MIKEKWGYMEESFFVHDGEDVLKLDVGDIDIDELISLFLEFPERTVYITDYKKYKNDRITGIITQGDFRRYLDGRKSVLYNDKFTVCQQTEEGHVRSIFEQKKKIMSVPIVNEGGEIVKEYYRMSERKGDTDYFAFVENIYQEAYLSKYVSNIFVLDSLSEEQKKRAGQIEKDTQGKVILTDNIVSVLAELEGKEIDYNNIWIYEMRAENVELARMFYQRKKIPHLFLDAGRIESVKYMNKQSNYFTGIAYLGVNYDIQKRLEGTECFCKKYEVSDFSWDDTLKCYRCIGEVPEEIEVFFTYLKLTKDRFYVMVGERYVPVLSRFCDYVRIPNVGEQISDEDIAFNIIPKLQKNGITCIAIEHPEKEYAILPKEKKFIALDLPPAGIFDSQKGGEAYEVFWKRNGDWNEEFLKERLRWSSAVTLEEGFLEPGNVYGKYINYYNGERYTCGNPEKYDNTIFLFGGCNVWGSTVTDAQTLGSCIRKKVSKKYFIKNCGGSWENLNYHLRKHRYKLGDIVIIFTSRSEAYRERGIPLYSIWEAYRKMPEPGSNIWDTLYHGNALETKYIADVLQKIVNYHISLDKHFEAGSGLQVTFGNDMTSHISIPDGLKEWLRDTRKYRIAGDQKAGAIVMNCNPFTLGHRYLIEEAKKQVEILYIFVVEENKSFFDFQDRLNMVQIGIKDMENVVIVPSGKYIISSATLPGYFEKEKNPEVEFDATEDLEIFGRIIAKEFSIQIRFAGEEPNDQFTSRYNDFMKIILPEYGVEFCEIPRKEQMGEVISASKVRKCIKDKNYDILSQLIMPGVCDYLKEHHFLE